LPEIWKLRVRTSRLLVAVGAKKLGLGTMQALAPGHLTLAPLIVVLPGSEISEGGGVHAGVWCG